MALLKRIIRKLLRLSDNALHVSKVLWGILFYSFKGYTPPSSYQSMIMLNCRSNRRATEVLGKWFSSFHPINFAFEGQGILGSASSPEITAGAEKIKQDGYANMGVKLRPEQIAALNKLSLELPAKLEGRYATSKEVIRKVYTRHNPESKTYKFDERDLILNKTVQELMADPSLHALAAQYLGATPILCSVNMWWSSVMPNTPLTPETDDAAQMYHFDMSRCKWVNFFFYLTDVDKESGPHCFVKGTHTPQMKRGSHLLERGYSRIYDYEILEVFSAEEIIETVGPAGTFLAEDTKGFHKGVPPLSRDRLMFEMIFAVSLFGGSYDIQKKPAAMIPELERAMKEKTRIFSRFS